MLVGAWGLGYGVYRRVRFGGPDIGEKGLLGAWGLLHGHSGARRAHFEVSFFRANNLLTPEVPFKGTSPVSCAVGLPLTVWQTAMIGWMREKSGSTTVGPIQKSISTTAF